MKNFSRHHEWLSLIEISGPFLSVPVLEKVFPQGLDIVETNTRKHIRSAYEEWWESVENNDPELNDLHLEWVNLVLTQILEYDDEVLFYNQEIKDPFFLLHSDGNNKFYPELLVRGEENEKPLLFISIQDPKRDLFSVGISDGWYISIMERMTMLCKSHGVTLGLITNGEQWMLVHTPTVDVSGHISWYSRLWFQEPATLKAFQSLLGVRRFFGPNDEKLDALLLESLELQEDVTETLGEQVRRAVEVLVQALDKADEDRNRELLKNVTPKELYEAGLAVMMRLVFILCAEERGLLLLGDPVYDQFYALSNLRSQLSEDSDRFGPEVLERRHDAWARLLTLFRVVYGGVEHESLRLAPLGGALFDPDRYPFLEGRQKGSDWTKDIANPIPIDNRTVLLLLNSLQVLEQHGGAIFLSYKGLDVEQIGHVYEGLLEYTVVRVPEVTLGLIGSQKAQNPNVPLSLIETAIKKNSELVVNLIKEKTERSETAIRNAINSSLNENEFSSLIKACGGDLGLAERIRPFMKLLRTDAWGSHIVYRENSFIVTLGVDRRETGTHYTPKSLTESIISTTLEPLVYHGPSEGKKRAEWRIKSSSEILNLKICDLAMGSGAFLVQACRWIAQRLIEAWAKEEEEGKVISIDGKVNGAFEKETMPIQTDERLLFARRIVAEKCLYGVDLNPMAVELAKLSIWLITLSKGRPFGFLDHNFRYGDSLLGIYNIEQLKKLSLFPSKDGQQLRIFGNQIEETVNEVIRLRKSIRGINIIDINDVKAMVKLDHESRKKLQDIELIADAMIGEALKYGDNSRFLNAALDTLSSEAWGLLKGDFDLRETLEKRTLDSLSQASKNNKQTRRPFHWPLEFPEVFTNDGGGFDAIVGNPPFMGGRRMRGSLGDSFVTWLSTLWPHASLNADLVSFFYLRAASLLKTSGELGLLATKTISEGDTARTGLSHIVEKYNITIRYALSSFPWPGKASVTAAQVVGHKGIWKGEKFLDGNFVKTISPALDDQEGWGEAKRLNGNKDKCFQGSVLRGKGFILSTEEAKTYIEIRSANKEVIFPFISGEDLNSHPEQKASRWTINFKDSSLEECEKKWPELLERLKQLVKPEREKAKKEADRRFWWQYWRKREKLYEQIKEKEQVFAISSVTKYLSISRVSSKQVFSHAVFIFDLSSWSKFSELQCSFHELWVRRESSSMEERIRYTSSDSFDTYPFLREIDGKLNYIGQKYHEFRHQMMVSRDEGLTQTYNRFHNPNDLSEDIQKLRKLHEELDKAVAKAYGWEDLKLNHDFYDTKYGVRFTISEEAGNAVIQLLIKLNHKLYNEENMSTSRVKSKTKKSKQPNSKKSKTQQLNLFDNK